MYQDRILTDCFTQHFPNITSVVSNNETATTYQSLGRIEMSYPAPTGNCSQQ